MLGFNQPTSNEHCRYKYNNEVFKPIVFFSARPFFYLEKLRNFYPYQVEKSDNGP